MKIQRDKNIMSLKDINTEMNKKARKHKYNAKRGYKSWDGKSFDSKREATRYESLKNLQREGKVKNLELQKSYDLIVNGVLICRYKADFVYRDQQENMVVEDSKGMKTQVYRLKKKLMKAVYGIDVLES